MRKKLSFLLAALMLASSCFAGCAKAPVSSQSAGSGDAGDSSSAAQQLEPKTIQMWLPDNKGKDADMVWEAWNKKLQEYVPNTTVEITQTPFDGYGEKYKQMLASKEGVDLAWIANWVTGDTNENIKNGNMMALDDLMDQYGQGIKEVLGDKNINLHRYTDGKLYYLISWQGLCLGKRGYFMPTELTKLAGDTWLEDTQKVVTKWWNTDSSLDDFQAVIDQFSIYFESLKAAGKLYAGCNPARIFGWNYGTRLRTDDSVQLQHIGVTTGDNTFTVVDSIQTDYFRLLAKNMADYFEKGYIKGDIASIDTTLLACPKNNNYTPNTTVIDVQTAYLDNFAEAQSKDYGTEMSGIFIEDQACLGKGDATAMSIPYCADEPERAMMVLNAIYSKSDVYQTLIYGIEGRNYKDNGDGTGEVILNSDGEKDYGLEKWFIGSCKNALTTNEDVPGYYQGLEDLEKEAYVNPFVNFVFDQSDVEDIVASLKAIDVEYYEQLQMGYTGSQWEATLTKYIAERKAAGVDNLIAEYQSQLNEYIKQNNITSW